MTLLLLYSETRPRPLRLDYSSYNFSERVWQSCSVIAEQKNDLFTQTTAIHAVYTKSSIEKMAFHKKETDHVLR